jgi:urease accessory protein
MERLTARAIARSAPGAPADSVTLDYEGRFLRRRTLVTDSGRSLFVDLAETVSLDEGDAFVATDGALVAVRAAAEPLIEATAPAEELTRLAWHVGNRHAPAQVEPGRLLVRADPVIADMLARLGARVRGVVEPFSPEGGAYGHGRTHGHHHGGAGDDPHAAAADPAGDPGPRREHGHSHGHSHPRDHTHG